MTVADDLRAGAQYIREHGHAKKTAEANDGSVCAMGGIARGMDIPAKICYGEYGGIWVDQITRFDSAVGALSTYLFLTGDMGKYYAVSHWNDASRGDDVIAGMEKAAAWVEEQA